ncbi:MAG: ABC transporter substrate-binding protein [Clostridiales bacterium]|jgi:putative ABC transport system substrate-binding protein|nr:ABC transporter substrate-binding protein [Clostridiales bacterium]
MKKIISIILVAMLAISLTACGVQKQDGKVRIGILQFVNHPSVDNITQGVKDGLASLGYNDSNAIIDFQIANADSAVANTIATKFVADKCDVIVAVTTGAAQAAYNVTRGTDIPVVFVAVSDPIGAGVVESSEKPNTNVTGVSDLLDVDSAIGLVKTLLPQAKTIGVVYSSGEANAVKEAELLKAKALKEGLNFESETISSTADVPLAMDAILSKNVDVIVNTLDNTLVSALNVELDKANAKNIPVIGSTSEQVSSGCLGSDSFDQFDVGGEAAPIIDRVIKGESPNDIPVINCTKTKMVVNKKVAEKFSISIPEGASIIE